MTGDDLKRLQDNFLGTSKKILQDRNRLRPIGFVVTLRKHVDRLFNDGYIVDFIDPKECLRDASGDDSVATLVIDLFMDWRRLYYAVLNVFPKTRPVLPQLLALAEAVQVDDPYMRTMRPFLQSTGMDEKDVIAATMRHVCDKVDAFACIFHSEAWMRTVEPSETVDGIYKNAPEGLGQDAKSIEVVISSMETRDFARMITIPIRRGPSKKRDGGKVLGFGKASEKLDTPDDDHVIEGRLVRFLKPLPVAS